MKQSTIILILFISLAVILSAILTSIDFLGINSDMNNLLEWTKVMQENCSDFGGTIHNSGIFMTCEAYYIDDQGFKVKYYLMYDLEEKRWYNYRD